MICIGVSGEDWGAKTPLSRRATRASRSSPSGSREIYRRQREARLEFEGKFRGAGASRAGAVAAATSREGRGDGEGAEAGEAGGHGACRTSTVPFFVV